MPAPDFTIITPTFNGLAYLKQCRASIADQAGVDVEHIVVDGASTDGTVDWLKQQEGLTWISEKDRGMYDAVNKGLDRAAGRYVAYLNCDEQYLPGALAAVRDAFERAPRADFIFGDMLVVRPDGNLAAFRKSYPLRLSYVLSAHLYVPTCALFWRRRVVESGLRFDTAYRDTGDADFVVRALRAGHRARHLRRYLAAFTVTGQNMSMRPSALQERANMLAAAPAWIRALRLPLHAARLCEKGLHGAYRQRFPIEYALHTDDAGRGRKPFYCASASFHWPDA
jgi:glycosyltransferase involved in cell wall biosynthesis